MPTETGIYLKEEGKIGHLHSLKLLENLTVFLSKEVPIIDFGCGTGYYVDQFNARGYRAIGVDGVYEGVSDEICVADFSAQLDLGVKGNVISLEVGEHIPEKYENIFINNITYHCNSTLVLSWAVVGQPGIGHINCRNNDYIISKIIEKGFYFDYDSTNYLKSGIEPHCNYFYNTLMVFKRHG